jgi:hypothetical protein
MLGTLTHDTAEHQYVNSYLIHGTACRGLVRHRYSAHSPPPMPVIQLHAEGNKRMIPSPGRINPNLPQRARQRLLASQDYKGDYPHAYS